MGTDNSTPHCPGDYDVQVRRTIPYYDRLHLEALDLVLSLGWRPRIWLDTGCGTGAMVKAALHRLPGTEFIMTDPSEQMLSIAKLELEGEERVHFLKPQTTQELRGKLEEAPDLITAIQCHHYLSSDERCEAVKVCYDLLVPGGMFVTFENARPCTAMGTTIGIGKWYDYLVREGWTREEAKALLSRFDKDYFPITVEEHLDLLRGIGFGTVELLWYSYMQVGLYCIK